MRSASLRFTLPLGVTGSVLPFGRKQIMERMICEWDGYRTLTFWTASRTFARVAWSSGS